MARPTSRKGTVNQVYRKRLPADVKRILAMLPDAYRPRGWTKEEIVITLGTADARKAAAEHARISHEVEQRLAALRQGVRTLSMKEATALVGLTYKDLTASIEEDPGSVRRWGLVMVGNADARLGLSASNALAIKPEESKVATAMEERFGAAVDALLATHALVVDARSRTLLIRELARGLDDAATKLARNAEGDYRPDPAAERFPEWKPQSEPAARRDKLTLPALFDRWSSHPEQAETARRTKDRYRGVFAAVTEFLKNPDARDVTTDHLQGYVDARMEAEGMARLKPVAARDVHKAALSSIYNWAAGRKLVKGNPAAGVRIKVTKARKLRAKETTDAETRQLVAAALAIPEKAAAGTQEAARRWCSLIAVYTGCRIGEACQLRRQDIGRVDGLPAITITPEAGDVKSGEARAVPVHPRLVELGLLSFVERSSDGPLFYDPSKRRRAKASTPQYELTAGDVAGWARLNGLADPLLVRPMHALRHRFMSLARRAGIEEQYVTAITGHEPGNMNRRYGTFPLSALAREIARLRPEDVEGGAA